MGILDHEWVVWVLLGSGVALALWALFWDRARGRKRCRRCQYDMQGSLADAGGAFVCPECGTRHTSAKHLLRTRRRWRWAWGGALLMLGSYAYDVAPGVRDRGWVAAVPTWVLVLGPMEVTLSDDLPAEFKVTSGWPEPLAEEYDDWLGFREPQRFGPGANPFTFPVERNPPGSLLQAFWDWRIERKLRAQGQWWDASMPRQWGLPIAVSRLENDQMLLWLGWHGDVVVPPTTVSQCGTMNSVFSLSTLDEFTDPGISRRHSGLVFLVEELSGMMHAHDATQYPYLGGNSARKTYWLWGPPESLGLFQDLLKGVLRVHADAERGVWSSVEASELCGQQVVVRSMPDIYDTLNKRAKPVPIVEHLQRKYAGRGEGSDYPRELLFASRLEVIDRGYIAVALQTPEQRDAMDADLAAWRRELGLTP